MTGASLRGRCAPRPLTHATTITSSSSTPVCGAPSCPPTSPCAPASRSRRGGCTRNHLIERALLHGTTVFFRFLHLVYRHRLSSRLWLIPQPITHTTVYALHTLHIRVNIGWLQGDKHFSQLITEKLSDVVKLVGPTVSCEGPHRLPSGALRANPHIPSFPVATDQAGAPPVRESPPPPPTAMQQKLLEASARGSCFSSCGMRASPVPCQ